MPALSPRYFNSNNNCGYYNDCTSAWDGWARYVVIVLIIVGFIFAYFFFACLSARRRRAIGVQPYAGTGWLLGKSPPSHGVATYGPPGQAPSQQPYYQNYGGFYNAHEMNPAYPAAPPPYENAASGVQQPQPVYGGQFRNGEDNNSSKNAPNGQHPQPTYAHYQENNAYPPNGTTYAGAQGQTESPYDQPYAPPPGPPPGRA